MAWMGGQLSFLIPPFSSANGRTLSGQQLLGPDLDPPREAFALIYGLIPP